MLVSDGLSDLLLMCNIVEFLPIVSINTSIWNLGVAFDSFPLVLISTTQLLNPLDSTSV